MNETENSAIEILTFKNGILGFEDIDQYILNYMEESLPFLYLRALGKKHPCFVVCDPMSFVHDYSVSYDVETLRDLEAQSIEDIRCLVIATVPENITDMTVNLKSPILYNIRNNLAKQYVMDNSEYPIRYKLFTEVVDRVC